jgi:hypothetical protein
MSCPREPSNPTPEHRNVRAIIALDAQAHKRATLVDRVFLTNLR